MTVTKIMEYVAEKLMEEKEWIFSGIGVFVITHIYSKFKKNGNDSVRFFSKEKNSETNISGSHNIVGKNQNITNNYLYADTVEKNEESWFSKRFYIFLSDLNKTRKRDEKEYTIEYISSLLGLKSVEELKIYLGSNKEPDDAFKSQFVEVFGVNKDWMIHNRGEYSFAPNLTFSGYNPMNILRKEDLKNIERFILVVGDVEGKRKACIIRKKGLFCYEVYPKYFSFNSYVGGTGTRYLVELYRFLREAQRINKLDPIVYKASEAQMIGLMKGTFSPKSVELFEPLKDFIEDFLSIGSEDISRNQKYWDDEFVAVQKIVAEKIKSLDEDNQQYDLMIIAKNLGELDNEQLESFYDIDMFSDSTPFFSYRLGKAFPGVRGMKEFVNPEECIERLGILLKEPLNGKICKDRYGGLEEEVT